MRELPGLEAIEHSPTPQASIEEPKKSITRLNVEKTRVTLKNSGYPRPNDFFDFNVNELSEVSRDVNEDVKRLTGQINGKNR